MRERLRDNNDSANGQGGKSKKNGGGGGRGQNGAGGKQKTGAVFGLVRDVRPYLIRRDDVNSVGMQSVLASL